MQKILISIACLAFLLISHVPAFAAKVRVRKSSGAKGVTYSTAKLSRPTNSVIVTFINLGNVSKVSYELSYIASGIQQGAMGSLSVSGQTSDTRDLYFGTCSHGVCTPHYSIKNATLIVRTQFKSGGTNVKLYRIKV